MKRSARRASLRLVHRDRYVPYLLGRISKSMASAASVLYRSRLGVGINDSRIIVVLARRPRITGKELAEDTSLNKSVISRSLSTLRAKGIVRIEEREGRREVELTPSGRGLHDRISKVALAREDLSDCAMYSTSRPCSSCERTAAQARLARMYYGPDATDAGAPR